MPKASALYSQQLPFIHSGKAYIRTNTLDGMTLPGSSESTSESIPAIDFVVISGNESIYIIREVVRPVHQVLPL
jgi:hypothetical protein